ncbi:MAG: mannose-6-phosphate isomerase, class I, partial [Treponema sp.]|nr:mannose-6-phosphate isomerase, class I [Treponema sp.]
MRIHLLKKPEFLELHNQVKIFPWGSKEWIPQLLGKDNTENLPWAELWMGAHPDAPSTVRLKKRDLSLLKLIKKNRAYYLGKPAAKKYHTLPFLFKILAADTPLSIQVHPNLLQAQEGFKLENKKGIPRDDPVRNYKDTNHKPEFICALTPFTVMCGFRRPAEILELFNIFLGAAPDSLKNSMKALAEHLNNADTGAALKDFLRELFALDTGIRRELSNYIINEGTRQCAAAASGGMISGAQWESMKNFARLYPGDPAVISPLYLNLFTLEPGEAIFLDAGTLHSYIHGLGVEVMANSDNVLRGGLTSKHIDIPELVKVLNFSPYMPEIERPSQPNANFFYPAPCTEFSLSVYRGAAGEIRFCNKGPAICIVVSGELEIIGANSRASFKTGQSVFIPPLQNKLMFKGIYTLYLAEYPAAAAGLS